MIARENPFRTDCLDGLSFRFLDGSMSELFDRLMEQGWRGVIVGPHGSGKTTLLDNIMMEISRMGFRVRFARVDDRSRRLPRGFMIPTPDPGDFLCVDGVDLLPIRDRLYLKYRSKVAGGLVVTSHRPGFLPVLYECRTSEQLLKDLTLELLADHDVSGFPDLGRLYDSTHGNLREVFLTLYDRCATQRMS